MFDIAWSELLVIAVVALVVIGPKDLPAALRTFGRMMGKVRSMASEFQGQFNEAMREAELDGLRNELAELKRTTHSMLDMPNPSNVMRDEIRKAMTDKGSTRAGGAAADTAAQSEAATEAGTAATMPAAASAESLSPQQAAPEAPAIAPLNAASAEAGFARARPADPPTPPDPGPDPRPDSQTGAGSGVEQKP